VHGDQFTGGLNLADVGPGIAAGVPSFVERRQARFEGR
jgi:hypothetical protein